MNGYYSKPNRPLRALFTALSVAGVLLLPRPVSAEPEILTWARIEFLRNQVQLVPLNERGRRARISDMLDVGDSLRTSQQSRAELRFNDGSLARIGERATFRFTPNTRNFQLTNGTVLLLIPPERGRSTIQTPNAVTGIQGSALFVRYIPETDTTIVGALTDNPNGPMVLFNRDGTEQQALRANEIGVIEGDRITQLYQFDGALFWQSSGLAEGFNLDASSSTDSLDAVRQEIKDALANQEPLEGEGVVENPDTFNRPDTPNEATPSNSSESPSESEGTSESPPSTPDNTTDSEAGSSTDGATSSPPAAGGELLGIEGTDSRDEPALEFPGSPAETYLNTPIAPGQLSGQPGDSNLLAPAPLTPGTPSGPNAPADSQPTTGAPSVTTTPGRAEALPNPADDPTQLPVDNDPPRLPPSPLTGPQNSDNTGGTGTSNGAGSGSGGTGTGTGIGTGTGTGTGAGTPPAENPVVVPPAGEGAVPPNGPVIPVDAPTPEEAEPLVPPTGEVTNPATQGSVPPAAPLLDGSNSLVPIEPAINSQPPTAEGPQPSPEISVTTPANEMPAQTPAAPETSGTPASGTPTAEGLGAPVTVTIPDDPTIEAVDSLQPLPSQVEQINELPPAIQEPTNGVDNPDGRVPNNPTNNPNGSPNNGTGSPPPNTPGGPQLL